ncbi:MAG TPA: DUF1573 domain-containing protein [Isosphaeraceae bacterium]|jgi:hypothetical protein|nr:DUF1573 domain-containing protein [Isosphaeraceae bacterium]
MVRWLLLVVLAVALAASAAVLMPYLSGQADRLPGPSEHEGPAPIAAVVEGDLVHEFGIRPQQTVDTWQWTIRNDGQADLVLKLGSSTCKCTIAELGKDETTGELKSTTIKPGKSWVIKLQWDTKEVTGKFEQSATIVTNDPERPELKFVARGEVQPPILSSPATSAANLQEIPNGEGRTAEWFFASPDRPDLKIEVKENSRPELIEPTVRPMTEDECREKGVPKGVRVAVQVKPSTRLGYFREEVLLATDHPKRPELSVFVIFKLVGPITASPGTVIDHQVSGDQGKAIPVTLTVKGRDATRFTVVEKPGPFKVDVEPLDEQARGPEKVRRYRMTITIPPGTPSEDYHESIRLKTDHPHAEEVEVPVDIIVG